MKKILITGSTGYVGSALSEYLLSFGYDCTGVDSGFFANSLMSNPVQTKTIYKDVRDIDESFIKGFDVLVHLAGISNDPMGKLDGRKIYDPTRDYSLKLAKICKKLSIRFIFASSCSVYGVGSGELLSEESAVNPQTLYSLNKYEIEQDLAQISGDGFSPIALRFSTIYGPSPRIRFDLVMNMFLGMAITDGVIVLNSSGLAWRPNLYILDACKAIRASIELDYRGNDLLVMNIGSDESNMQIIDMAKIVQRVVPGTEIKFLSENPELDAEGLINDRKVKNHGNDVRTYKVSFAKVKAVIPGFNCDYSLEKGAQSLLEFLEKAGLTRDLFKSRGFYRLQQLEYLYENGFLSDNLLWTKERI